jgi:hypothetical protein
MARYDPTGDNDAALLDRVAHDMLDRYGDRAVAYLRDHALEAAHIGDVSSERTWLDIAERAADLILERETAVIGAHVALRNGRTPV